MHILRSVRLSQGAERTSSLHTFVQILNVQHSVTSQPAQERLQTLERTLPFACTVKSASTKGPHLANSRWPLCHWLTSPSPCNCRDIEAANSLRRHLRDFSQRKAPPLDALLNYVHSNHKPQLIACRRRTTVLGPFTRDTRVSARGRSDRTRAMARVQLSSTDTRTRSCERVRACSVLRAVAGSLWRGVGLRT